VLLAVGLEHVGVARRERRLDVRVPLQAGIRLRDQLGGKAQARSAEFSWRQSADAMRSVLESIVAGDHVTGMV